MPVTLSGIAMPGRPVQPSNESLPMRMTPLGIVMLVRLVHEAKA